MQKGRLARVAIGLAALAMLCSCVAIPTIDQAKERQLVAQQIAAPVDNVTVLSRCQFGIVPGIAERWSTAYARYRRGVSFSGPWTKLRGKQSRTESLKGRKACR